MPNPTHTPLPSRPNPICQAALPDGATPITPTHCQAFWAPRSIQAATDGQWLVPPDPPTSGLQNVSIDSRAIEANQVFIALQGDRFDGHDFLTDALDAGAGLLVVSDLAKAQRVQQAAKDHKAQRKLPGAGVLHVPDTLTALQAMARAYRDCLRQDKVAVIAVTGSNGKTTTRHLIHAVLSAAMRGCQSPKSFNNHIGVPLTLLGTKPGERFVVVEVGSSAPGEIAKLAQLVKPDTAVITHIGAAHLEGFGGLEAVAKEKSALLQYIQPGGVGIVPGKNVEQTTLTQPFFKLPTGVALIRFGEGPHNDLRLTDYETDGLGVRFAVRNNSPTASSLATRFQVPLLGRHNATNTLAAIAVARWMGLSDTLIADALSHASGVPMRLNVQRLGTAHQPLVVINDAYNANPDAMIAALKALIDFPLPATPQGAGRRVAVLGDMLELGHAEPTLHRRVAQQLAQWGDAIHLVVCIGQRCAQHMLPVLSGAWSTKRVHGYPAWHDKLPQRVAALIRPGDVVLFKASRGMGLERLIAGIQHAAAQW